MGTTDCRCSSSSGGFGRETTMTDSDSDQQGVQIGGIHVGPIEYRFLKLVVYAVIGLFIWPYILLLYIYIAIRRFNKAVIKVSKKASETVRKNTKLATRWGVLILLDRSQYEAGRECAAVPVGDGSRHATGFT